MFHDFVEHNFSAHQLHAIQYQNHNQTTQFMRILKCTVGLRIMELKPKPPSDEYGGKYETSGSNKEQVGDVQVVYGTTLNTTTTCQGTTQAE